MPSFFFPFALGLLVPVVALVVVPERSRILLERLLRRRLRRGLEVLEARVDVVAHVGLRRLRQTEEVLVARRRRRRLGLLVLFRLLLATRAACAALGRADCEGVLGEEAPVKQTGIGSTLRLCPVLPRGEKKKRVVRGWTMEVDEEEGVL